MANPNIDDMDDEAFEAYLDQMEDGDVGIGEEAEVETSEDTDQTKEAIEETEDETQTNEEDYEPSQDSEAETEDEVKEEVEENTQVEESEDGDETDTDPEPVEEEGTKTVDLNYEDEYKKLLKAQEDSRKFEDFYNEVTSEFVANGKKVRGFTNPKDIIQAQQMAAGFHDKMASFKPYRKFMSTIKDKGMLDNPEKFDLVMNMLDGDKEALKQHIQNSEIDPYELDMDNIDYKGKTQVASNIELAFDDVMSQANSSGVGKEVQQVLSSDWDDQSVLDLLDDPQSMSDLVEHMNSGVYSLVQDKIADKKRADFKGVYIDKPAITQYREAAFELEQEYKRNQAQTTQVQNNEQIQQNTEYKAKVQKSNNEAEAARKKATSVSKRKPKTKTKKKVFDPGKLSDDDFNAMIDGFITS